MDSPCPYCQTVPVLKEASVHYSSPKIIGWIWICPKCQAMVGCHKGTKNPLGRLANSELRLFKRKAHAMFDQLWKTGRFTRKGAYQWLSVNTGIPQATCHIGMMDVPECKLVIEALTKLKNEKGTS